MSGLPEEILVRMTTSSLREALRLLRRAQTLLASPNDWCKYEWALDANGHPVSLTGPAAVRFCLSAAVLLANLELYGTSIETVPTSEFELLYAKLPKRVLTAFALLAYPLSTAWRQLHPEASNDSVTRAVARPVETIESARWPEQAPFIAAAVNDSVGIEWSHIEASLKLAVGSARDELRRRNRFARSPGYM